MTDGRTILVLGGTGFIGKNLATGLRQAGHRVFVTGHGGSAADHPGFRALPLDDVAAILRLIDDEAVDTVVHLACSLIPSSSEDAFLAERRAITDPTFRLASELASRRVRLVYVSSGGTIYGAVDKAAACETDPCAPISYYGHSKLETENHLRFLERTRGLRCLIVRPSNPYGPGQSMEGAQGLISVILGRMRSGRPLQVWGDGSAVRDYIYIDDLIASFVGLIESETDTLTINLGSGVGHSLLEIVAAIEAITGRELALEFLPARPTDIPGLVLDIARLRALGMDHARSLDAGLRTYLQVLETQW